MKTETSAILLISCLDQQGIVCAVTDFLLRYKGNVIDLEQHMDTEESAFFMRVERELGGFTLPRDQISEKFSPIAERHQMKYELHFSDYRPRIAIFVSKFSHCIHNEGPIIEQEVMRVSHKDSVCQCIPIHDPFSHI